ncbi:uncharacterized protein B0J16DRAFT_322246 [Fusarium flagelliforme]|uniref:uncharacterized protein n=1 Tax=Fusarium flagelliforme TaxID=2675880 RepID=UPI001E8D32F7|nr:uncharacterized protein B0J16DRAFT_322246 [Fusarium flagelliforme]KAH7183507.1 hypothetical protein B0J16DRAFT_322246 [Fusarium flagelliforme]
MSSRRHGSDRHRSHRHRSERGSNRPNDDSSDLSSDRYIDPGNSITNRPGEITDNDPLGIGRDPTWYDTQTDLQGDSNDGPAYEQSSLSEYFNDAMGSVLQEPYPSDSESAGTPIDPNDWYCHDCGKSLSSCHLFCSTCKRRSEPSSGSGKCIKCKAPTEGKAIFCPGHLNLDDRASFRRCVSADQKKTLVEEGACFECCRRKASQGRKCCSSCRDRKKISSDIRRSGRSNRGQCTECPEKLSNDDKEKKHTKCQDCRKGNREASRRRHEKSRK